MSGQLYFPFRVATVTYITYNCSWLTSKQGHRPLVDVQSDLYNCIGRRSEFGVQGNALTRGTSTCPQGRYNEGNRIWWECSDCSLDGSWLEWRQPGGYQTKWLGCPVQHDKFTVQPGRRGEAVGCMRDQRAGQWHVLCGVGEVDGHQCLSTPRVIGKSVLRSRKLRWQT